MQRIPETGSGRGERGFPHVRRIVSFAWIVAGGWTLILMASFAWYHGTKSDEAESVARAEARAAFGRDMLYRRWVSNHGGVYVPVTGQTGPNPYLAHVAERDITTPSGRMLTLINPAYMTRQVYELARGQEGVGRGHLTSLAPLRPENSPDPWEARALKAFERGVSEVFEIQDLDGGAYMRLMRPFVTEAACLKCHAPQGYRVGDIRGGISVSIPMQPISDISRSELTAVAAAHGMLWILGLGVVGFGSRSFARSSRLLEESELRYRTIADYTSDWEYWIARDGSFYYVSPSCESVCGFSPDEFYSDPGLLTQIIHPDDLTLYAGHRHRLSEQGTPESLDFRIRTKNGEVRWISHVCRPVYDAAGQPIGRRASNRDITDRKIAEQILQKQALLLEEEAASRQAAQEALADKQGQLETINQSLKTRVAESLAELRRKDQLLIQQGRLAAMGEMIHNIAHQWRQPLNTVGLIVQNLKLSHEANSLTAAEMEKEVDSAMGVIMHMSRTIDDFRNFFLPEKEKFRFVIKKTVEHALEFVGAALASSNIQVQVHVDEDVSAVGYENEYAQVLLNILANARDVLVERKITAPCISIRITSEKGRSVVLIRDNAGGIGEDILPKVFDPYFTTKEQGKGTGIGLYMSKAIIELNMEGALTVRNADSGAEFRIEV